MSALEALLTASALERTYASLEAGQATRRPPVARYCPDCEDGEIWVPRLGGNDPCGRFIECASCGGTGRL